MSSKTLIDDSCVVTLSYTVTDTLGDTLSHNTEPEAFLMGGDELLPKIQEALMGQSVGFKTKLHLEPEEAFGDYDASLIIMEARTLFPAETEPGLQFEDLPAGCKYMPPPEDERAVFTVTDVTDDVVVLDANHPLAGIAVRFELAVVGIREASEEELAAGGVARGNVLEVPKR
jgi:FKBP-type peptidyl-prolyl cis-trans isomerase SlyD